MFFKGKRDDICRKRQDIQRWRDTPHHLDVEFEGTFCYNSIGKMLLICDFSDRGYHEE